MKRATSRNCAAIVMAAGKGTRMKSDLAKVLHPLHGRAMINYVIRTARRLEVDPIVVVVGHQRERVMRELAGESLLFAVQEPQLGTGHAVACALPSLAGNDGPVLILSGDVPLIRLETLRRLIEHHLASSAVATVMTARTSDPRGYGRIVRQPSGNLQAIVEERDANDEIRNISEVNSGIYVFQLDELRAVLPAITNDNDQREYYLTDAIRLLTAESKTVAAFTGDFREVMGVNTAKELAEAEAVLSELDSL